MELRGSRGLCQERVTYSPFVEFVACGTMDSHILLPDAQKRANLGLYAAVDLPPGRRAHEDEVLHRVPPPQHTYSTSSCRHHDNHAIARYAEPPVRRIIGYPITESCSDMWPDRRILDLFKIEHPIVQAPVAGAMDWALAAEAAAAGALGSLPCAMLNAGQVLEQMAKIRARTRNPINLNFFCHSPPVLNNAREAGWRERLAPYYRELAIDPAAPIPSSNRAAFDAIMCEIVEETKP